MEGRNYICHACGTEYNEGEVMSILCTVCKKKVCIYCADVDVDTRDDVCDKCQDETMFNHVETHCDASLPKQQIAQ